LCSKVYFKLLFWIVDAICMMAGSHTMPRQENTDTKTSNHLPSTVEQPKSVETSKQRKLTTAQERRRALLQKALQQGGLFVEQS
jgi:hypothetical protein